VFPGAAAVNPEQENRSSASNPFALHHFSLLLQSVTRTSVNTSRHYFLSLKQKRWHHRKIQDEESPNNFPVLIVTFFQSAASTGNITESHFMPMKCRSDVKCAHTPLTAKNICSDMCENIT
jgi:hypothetical protein